METEVSVDQDNQINYSEDFSDADNEEDVIQTRGNTKTVIFK
jgi:hypothetical protein